MRDFDSEKTFYQADQHDVEVFYAQRASERWFQPKSRSWGITEMGRLGRETGVESRGLGGIRNPEI
jgi:hypothetical protein